MKYESSKELPMIESHFSYTKDGSQRIRKRWPKIRSMMNRD